MSITQFKNTDSAVLDSSNPVAVPLGDPVAVTSVTCVERSDGVETGIWECTRGAGGGRSCNRSSATSSRAAAPSPPTVASPWS